MQESVKRLPIVGVMGSGSEPHTERSRALGAELARLGVHLLTGGGGGVMREVSRAFCETPGRAGLCIGILPAGSEEPPFDPPRGYPHAWVEIPIRTHLSLRGSRGGEGGSRNAINILSSDAVVALPGGAGTSSEISLAVDLERPLVAFLADRAEIAGLPDSVRVEPLLAEVTEFLRDVLALSS